MRVPPPPLFVWGSDAQADLVFGGLTHFVGFDISQVKYCRHSQSLETLITDNPFKTNGIFHKATYNKGRMVHCINVGVACYNFQNNIAFLSLKINFFLTNSADPDKMPPNAAFHLGLHCLTLYPFRVFQSSKG